MLTGNGFNMLKTLRRIVHQVNAASDLDEVLAIIVTRVKQALEVDVCSVYLTTGPSNPGQLLLMASDGLNPEAIGNVSLGLDTGLVGLVAQRAEPVNLGNAPEHPRYQYFPETGEERYHAFLGAPIIHHGKVLGVLVVQSHRAEPFIDELDTFLFTIAAQLSGAILHAEAQGSLASRRQPLSGDFSGPIQGQPGAPGVAIGQAVVIHAFADIDSVPDRPAGDVEAELVHFREALERVRGDVREMIQRMADSSVSSGHTALFDAYLMMLDGDSLVLGVEERIRDGNWAPAALRDVVQEHARAFDSMEDPYLRERAQDVRDLGRRVLQHLEKEPGRTPREYPKDTVLVGEEITASMLAEVPQSHLVGVVSLRGSRTSHMAMLASAFGIPAVMGAEDVPLKRINGAAVIADGYSGRLYLNPGEEVCLEYIRLQREEEELAAGLRGLRHLPSETTDGMSVALYANTGLVADIRPALANGAEGVGLYRTEFPFMIREHFPSEEEQRLVYRQVLETFSPNPVVMRTLDIGGDKTLPYFPINEENPFLGWRGIRITLDHPEIFMVQLRAMLRANIDLDNLSILLPMVSSVREVDEAQALIQRAFEELTDEGYNVTRPRVGVMIEVPAAIYLAEELSRRVDFFSLGTNDLAQYLLAVDRNNVRVSDIFDTLHPAVLRAIRQVVSAAEKAKIPVSVCGEMASDPAAALALTGMGIRSLSMSATGILRIKWVVRSVSSDWARQHLEQVMNLETAREARSYLEDALRQAGLGGLVRAGKH